MSPMNSIVDFLLTNKIVLIAPIVFLSIFIFFSDISLFFSYSPSKIGTMDQHLEPEFCKYTGGGDEYSKYALITGGAGFIGRHFAHSLCSSGWQVLVVDDMLEADALMLPRWPAHLQCSSLRLHKTDYEEYFKLCSQTSFDLFIHMAGLGRGRTTESGSVVIRKRDLSLDLAAFRWNEVVRNGHMVTFSVPTPYRPSSTLGSSLRIGHRKDSLEAILAKRIPSNKLIIEALGSFMKLRSPSLNISIHRPATIYGEDEPGSSAFLSVLNQGHLSPSSVGFDTGEEMKFADGSEPTSKILKDFVYIGDVVDCVLQLDRLQEYSGRALSSGIVMSTDDAWRIVVEQLVGLAAHQQKYGMTWTPPTPNNVEHGEDACSFPTTLESGVQLVLGYKAELFHWNMSSALSKDGTLGPSITSLPKEKSRSSVKHALLANFLSNGTASGFYSSPVKTSEDSEDTTPRGPTVKQNKMKQNEAAFDAALARVEIDANKVANEQKAFKLQKALEKKLLLTKRTERDQKAFIVQQEMQKEEQKQKEKEEEQGAIVALELVEELKKLEDKQKKSKKKTVSVQPSFSSSKSSSSSSSAKKSTTSSNLKKKSSSSSSSSSKKKSGDSSSKSKSKKSQNDDDEDDDADKKNKSKSKTKKDSNDDDDSK